MQRICLNVCNSLQVKQAYEIIRYVADNEIDLSNVLGITSTSADFKTLVQTMHTGPKSEGRSGTSSFSLMGPGETYTGVSCLPSSRTRR